MKPVVIPPGYTITRDGQVISKRTGKPMAQGTNGSGHGYPSVFLREGSWRKHYAVYRLVAAVHLPPRPSAQHFVCHRDGNRMNSHADNLYWGTAKENQLEAWRHRRTRQNLGLPFAAD